MEDGSMGDSEPPSQEEILEMRLDAHSDRMESIERRMEELEEENKELVEENEYLRQRINELVADVESLMDRDKLLEPIAESAITSTEQRVARVMMTLHAKASSRDGRAEMDCKSIVDCLNGSIHRTTAYDVINDVIDIVDSDAVKKISEPRHATKNTRLRIDLEKEEWPIEVAGKQIGGAE